MCTKRESSFAYLTVGGRGRGIERNRIGIGIGIFEDGIGYGGVGKMGIRAEEREKKIGLYCIVAMECGGSAPVTRRCVPRSCSLASMTSPRHLFLFRSFYQP